LQADELIAHAVARLRSADLESSTGNQRNDETELTRLAVGISDESAHTEAELKRLRDVAAKNHLENRDLTVFSNALEGALGRQRRIASDLGGLLAYVDYTASTHDLPIDTRPPDPNPGDLGRRGSGGTNMSAETTQVPLTPYAQIGARRRRRFRSTEPRDP
jgi:hypothetical protein